MEVVLFLTVFLLCLYNVESFNSGVNRVSVFRKTRSSKSALNMVDYTDVVAHTNSLLVAAANADPDYVYGQVNAPSWVLPVGAVAVIATAALPFFLRSGEAALEQQRINEEETGSGFKKDSTARRRDRM